MNRKFLLPIICVFLFFNFSYGQSWNPVGTGVYGDGGIYAATSYNGDLYVGGWFYQAGSVIANNMARWNGSSWDSVGSGLTGGENSVDVMCVYQGKLYVGGAFFAAEGLAATNIAVWDGSHWDSVGGGLTYCGSGAGWVDAMAIYNGKLYVAGAFCHAGGIAANNIACWDGTKWDSVSSGINDSIYALTVYNGRLYAGGSFSRAGTQTVSNIAYWNDTAWNAVPYGTNNAINALAVYKDTLYVGGIFTLINHVLMRYIASWNGATWSAVGDITGTASTYNPGVYAFCVYNGLLYTGGFFNGVGGLNTYNIATWNGAVWDTVSTNGINSLVDAFTVIDSNLYAGGVFTDAGNVAASDIAVLGSASLGINEVGDKSENIIVYPNPNKGFFTIQSSVVGQSIVEIYNVLGEKVYSQSSIQKPIINIDISHQPTGIYLYRLLDSSGIPLNQGKIVVE